MWWPWAVFTLAPWRFTEVTGEHTIRYDDGEAEDLLLPLQRVKWLYRPRG